MQKRKSIGCVEFIVFVDGCIATGGRLAHEKGLMRVKNGLIFSFFLISREFSQNPQKSNAKFTQQSIETTLRNLADPNRRVLGLKSA